ncbi:hypothetical protein BpHYR1_016215 [Brachionus plicatilis]|uniref:Uncharacterized protein n=1 Tax=Brachionus plicatilis TaxID=10195 RepID=A0A3M7RI11_BRAPC|nr:hypothetical protein BpHYR1_016215 [Brachionus plicatilis]
MLKQSIPDNKLNFRILRRNFKKSLVIKNLYLLAIINDIRDILKNNKLYWRKEKIKGLQNQNQSIKVS